MDCAASARFPATGAAPPPALLDALGAAALWTGRGVLDWLVELESEEAVRALAPDRGRVRALGARGVIVTAASEDPEFDFVSRFFAPGAGIDEDPVTGSAHCCLGPYWGPKLGRTQMRARQVSARGGIVGVALAGERVRLIGQAVTVMRCELLPGALPAALRGIARPRGRGACGRRMVQ